MSRPRLALLFVCWHLPACQRVLSDEAVEALPVFAPFQQPWAKDARGTDTGTPCEHPFGFDLGLDRQVAEAVYLALVEPAHRRGDLGAWKERGGSRLDEPLFEAPALEAMREAERKVWRALLLTSSDRHEPRAPAPSEDAQGPERYVIGRVCTLPAAPGYARAASIAKETGPCGEGADTRYHWNDEPGNARIERPDLLSLYDAASGILLVRTPTLLLLAKRCEGFGCVEVDWVELGPIPFVEHMKFDESGGSGERHVITEGTSRLQQRAYRRDQNGYACEDDRLERNEVTGALLRPWTDPANATDAPFAKDVFGKAFGIGAAATLASPAAGSDGVPAAGSVEVLRWRAGPASDLESTIVAGFTGSVDGAPKSFALALPAATLGEAKVFHVDGTETALTVR